MGCDGRVKSKASWWKSGKRREIMGERSDCIADKTDTLRGHWLRDCVLYYYERDDIHVYAYTGDDGDTRRD